MRRLLPIALVVALGLSLASPALAGHRDRSRGHHRHHLHHHRGKECRIVHNLRAPRPRAGFFVGFGAPLYGYAPFYRPVIVAPAPIYVPGGYFYGGGGGVYLEGRWR